MEKFNTDIDNTLALLEKYKITPTELFLTKILLLAKEEGDYEPLKRYASIGNIRETLESLRNKEIVLKSYKIPKSGEKFIPENVEFNKNFLKQFFRASFEMGKELFDIYPQTTIVNGSVYNLRRVSKKFDSLEDAFLKYAKYINNSPEKHNRVIELVKWGIENGYNFTTLDDFICDNAWLAIEAIKDGGAINVNTNAIKMI